MKESEFVKDIHGHVYIYVPQYHEERIGRGLEFTEHTQTEAQAKTQKQRSFRTLQELREAAAKVGLDIPDGTPFAKAQNMYAKHLELENETNSISGDDLIGLGAFDNAGKTNN